MPFLFEQDAAPLAIHRAAPQLLHRRHPVRAPRKPLSAPVPLRDIVARLRPRTFASTSDSNVAPPSPGSEGSTVVWLKHDLRLDDHPGFTEALKLDRPIHAVFVAAPSLLSALLPIEPSLCKTDAELLALTLANLRATLAKKGIPLTILRTREDESSVGPILTQFTQSVGATTLLAEDEVEHAYRAALQDTRASLPASTQLRTWQARLYDTPAHLDNYTAYAEARALVRPNEPLPVPSLPDTASAVDSDSSDRDDLALSAAEIEALATATRLASPPAHASVDTRSGLPILPAEAFMPYATVPASFVTGALAANPLACFQDYLAARLDTETTRIATALETPAAPGASFHVLFRPALALGLLSPRRVFAEASRVQQPKPRFRNPLDVTVAPADAAVNWCQLRDFGAALAAKSLRDGPGPSGFESCTWNWRGVLSNYIYAPAAPASSSSPSSSAGEGSGPRPAILLVHGFGAFPEHYRRNIGPLAEAGYDVYSICLPGYGRSEKPSLPYSQYLWAQFCADFVTGVIGQPVVLAGNSIGGFISTTVAALLTSKVVSGVVLLNSAGKIDPAFTAQIRASPAGLEKLRERGNIPSVVVEAASRGLFGYLQGSVKGQLTRLYPTVPSSVDDYLADEIQRASSDPGALGVFRSAFFLPPPVPIDYNLAAADCPVLVLQGVLDPLNDSKARARDLETSLRGVSRRSFKVVRMQLGHCPMDEDPAAVNREIQSFLEDAVLPFMREQQQGGKVASAAPAAATGAAARF